MPRTAARPVQQRRLLAAPLIALTTGAFGPVPVHSGDTLWGLAREHHTSVAALQQANGLRSDRIYAGHTLRVPGAGTSAVAGGRPDRVSGHPAAPAQVRYRVGSGDYLIRIAARFHVSPAAIAAANHLGPASTVYLGSTLRIPAAAVTSRPTTSARAGSTSAAPRTYPSATTAAAARSRAILAARPRASKSAVQGTIRRTAAQLGVDPSLALAVGYQESGFQQHVVSPANAIGAMQVLPSTGDWLSRDVVGRRLNLYDPHDNAVAGVSLLRSLLHSESPPRAVAAYYQGLGSVRRHGLYADTRAYVHSVLTLQKRFR